MPRNSSIDIAKGIGILLVVLGHNWILTHDPATLGFQVIYSFHMPLFFFLSGIFLNPMQHFLSLVRTRADALIKPYAVVLILLGVYKVGMGYTTPGRYFPGVAYGVGSTLDWSPMWFLPCLFITLLLAWLLLNILREERYPRLGLSIIIAALLLLGAATIAASKNIPIDRSPLLTALFPINANLDGLPFSIDILPISMAFLLLGYLLRQQLQTVQLRLPYLLGAVLLLVAGQMMFSAPTDLNTRVYGHWLLTPIRALAGIYIVVTLSTLIARYRLLAQPLAYLGKVSLFILIFHSYVEWAVFSKLTSRFPGHQYAIGAITFIGAVAISVALFEISRRVTPMSLLLTPLGAGKPAEVDASNQANGTPPQVGVQ